MRKETRKNVTKILASLLIFSVIFMDFALVLPTNRVLAVESTNTTEDSEVEIVEEDSSVDTDQELDKTEQDSEAVVEEPEQGDQPASDSEQEGEPSQEEAAISEPVVETTEEVPTINEEDASTDKEETIDNPDSEEVIDFNTLPQLLLTEVMPNNNGADDFEYFEIYNNSNQSIILDHHKLAIRYTDGSGKEDVQLAFSEATIDSGQTLVFWRNASGHSLADFNAHYATALSKEDVVEYTGTGFSNSGNRALVVKNTSNETIISANYLSEDIASGKVVDYQYPKTGTEMVKSQTLSDPNPGSLIKEQVPDQKVTLSDHTAPTINHQELKQIEAGKDMTIEASIASDQATISAKLYYQTDKQDSYQMIEMTNTETSTYQAVIPGNALRAETLTYYILATDPNHRVSYPPSIDRPIEVSIKKEEEEVEDDFNNYPHLLITELAPNSKGGGTDNYEYFELYNNTNQALTLTNYTFVYRYTDSGKDVPFQIPATVIESKQTLVFWYNNSGKELSDFNQNFGLDLTDEQVIEVTDTAFPGFANGGDRALLIKDNQGEQVTYADYLGSENDNTGAVIAYQYPRQGTTMVKYRTMADPTPGIIESEQVPKSTVTIPEIEDDTEAPQMSHTPVTEVDAFTAIKLEAIITDDKAVPVASLYIKGEDDEQFTSLAMSPDPENPSNYAVNIPGVYVESDITYYLESTDGTNVSKTEAYKITVHKDDVDVSKVPGLLVTEVVPDSTNVGSADGYEFIEIYNNTDQAINFKDYKLRYRYGSDPESDIMWPSIPDDVVIPSKETLVFWIINGQNDTQTVADFNSNYNTSLVENEDIVKIYSAGMANGSMRGLLITSNTGQEVSIAYYNDVETIDDTQADKGIVYKYPVDGSNVMEKISAGLMPATPGNIEAYQVPKQQIALPSDEHAPTIENLTDESEVLQTDNIDILADVQDEMEVKTVQVYYRTNEQETFQTALLTEDYDDMLYHHRIYSPEIIGKEYVEYYFVASDGVNQVTSDRYQVKVTNDLDDSSIRLNVNEGEIVNGEKVIKGTSKDDRPNDVTLSIDGVKQISSLYNAIEHKAYFAYEVSGINTYFQNGVTIGDEIIHIFDDWMAQWETITVPIEADQLQVGDNTITIRAGNKATPWEGDPGENRDDYNLRNVRLVLADGTILIDPTHGDPNQVYDMGDDGTDRISEDFIFTVTDELASSQSYLWDTTTISDGEHVITVADSDEELKTTVLVDNTAPTITTTIEEEKEYKGAFEIDVTILDEIAGVKNSDVWLDNKKIELPYQTSSGMLPAGRHQIKVEAEDHVGNTATLEVNFSVVDENPEKPGSNADELNDSLAGDPVLQVRVTDPAGDDMDVSFYQGYQYKPSDLNHVKSFSGASDVEPPNTPVLEGEAQFSEADISLTSKQDQQYMITDSTTQFPYHRFDVTVDNEVDENDVVEFVWKGNSLSGRKVTMYAWNHSTSQWNIVDYEVAGENDFELKGSVVVSDFVKDNKINVIVQDEIPATPEEYDYTFVWMSDTQYYSESYPHIYDRQTQWITEKQEEMNIKYVFHTGDLVDESDQEIQWENANNSMKTLDDANIPYGVLAGNHDVSQKTNDYTAYYKYFGADRFEDRSYYGGSYLNNRGHYDLISVDGNDYIMVYLGWGVEDEGIKWVNEVLAAHPDRKAILNFHEYMQATGTRHPLGEKLYEEVVLPNENVFAVLSGHYHESQLLVDEIDDDGDGNTDRTVYQMLADYQGGPEGGQGYMRLLHFDTDNNRILVNTYSPYLDDYNYYDTDAYPEKDEFILELDLAATEKRVATDYFAVNVYSDTEIGSVKDVSSGEIAEVTWKGLEEDKSYSWYAVVTDQFTGKTTSDIWSFIKGDDIPIEVPVEEDDEDQENEIPTPTSPVDETDQPNSPEVPGEAVENDGEEDIVIEPVTNENVLNETEKEQETPLYVETSDSDDGGSSGLANTSTNMFDRLLIGLISIIMSLVLLFFYRRKQMLI